MAQEDDGDYDIRAYTNCGQASVVSEVHSGHKDTRLPEPFGSPQPADGILSPNDEIQLNWTEPLDENLFYDSNIRRPFFWILSYSNPFFEFYYKTTFEFYSSGTLLLDSIIRRPFFFEFYYKATLFRILL